MDAITRILSSFRDTLPNDSKTAAAIDRGASPDEISVCATEEGLHALAGALFEACEQGMDSQADSEVESKVSAAVAERLKAFRHQIPASSQTARMIDSGASIEEISEAAQQEGLTSLATMLFEAEQEAAGRS